MLAEGDPAPDFEGMSSTGTNFKLSEQRGHPVVVYFFPEADTPGCTVESKGFRDHMSELAGRDVRLVGISTDSLEDEKKFAQKYGLNFPLVGDVSKQIASSFGVLKNGGRARRVTFLIGADGKVAKVIDSSFPGPHVEGACDIGWTK